MANSTFLSGYPQNLASALSSQSVTPNPSAQSGGYMNVLVAGDVTDSIFAASVEPFEGEFGTPDDLLLPQGQITAKVEGIIDNTVATPQSPGSAFFAQSVELETGPVTPPNVPELPFPARKGPSICRASADSTGGNPPDIGRPVRRREAGHIQPAGLQ